MLDISSAKPEGCPEIARLPPSLSKTVKVSAHVVSDSGGDLPGEGPDIEGKIAKKFAANEAWAVPANELFVRLLPD
jgi:hypothetical protein